MPKPVNQTSTDQKGPSNAKRHLATALAAMLISGTALPVGTAHAGGPSSHWHGGGHVSVASSGHRYRDYRRDEYRRHKEYRHRQKHKRSRNNGNEALAAGIIGFAIGAIIADQVNRANEPNVVYVPQQPQPPVRYTQPYPPAPPVYGQRRYLNDNEPRVVRYNDDIGYNYEPWSEEWANWCDNRYRSFNLQTGTYRGYDGRDHFCVVK